MEKTFYNKKEDKYINSESLLKPKKIRNPGIDFGRILAMFSIITHHILLHGKAIIKYRQFKELNKLNTSIFWHVSTYIFISGYIGYKSTRYSNLFYLWICTLFYSIGISQFFTIFKPHIFNKKIELIDFFPVLTSNYWYFTRYFGMYLFLPIINKGIENLNQSQFRVMIIILIIVYIILKDSIVPKLNPFCMNGGYSVIWFLLFYSTGAYFGKFEKNRNLLKKSVNNIKYILIFFFSTNLCFILQKYKINDNNHEFKDKIIKFLKSIFIMRINAFPMILQSISVILLVTNINYNKFIANIITFIGPLTFGIYLIHENKIIRGKIMKNILNKYSTNIPFYMVISIIFKLSLEIFIGCAIIDYFRNILFQILQIRRICIFTEKLVFAIIG